jgi:spermidine synthase
VESHPGVESIDSVELSEGVVHAAREYFGEFTGNVLDDPRSTVIIGDGRLHLEHSDRKYDVIISQPSNPWIAGASSLFTREAFEAMKRRLEPGGLACIWFQGFRMPVENFRSLSRTWAEVWKHPSIWESRLSGEYLFVGSDEPLRIDFDRLQEAFEIPAVREQMNAIRIPSPAHALGYLVIADDDVREVAGDAVLNTDDGSRIEYDTPKGMWRDHASEIRKLIGARRMDPWSLVTTTEPYGTEFRLNRETGRRILRDRIRSLEALDLPRDQAIAVLEEIVEANPYDADAARALRRLRRGTSP